MTTNVSVARRWFEEVWNGRRTDLIHELIGPGGKTHTEAGEFVDQQQFLAQVYQPTIGAFPDLHIFVDDTITEDDRVVVRWRAEGTHTGDGLGVPPTNRRVSFRGMTLIRFENGKMIEGFDSWNQGGLMHVLQSGQSMSSVKLL
jgi:steroid delta-isomerase-like uncharacterized protein